MCWKLEKNFVVSRIFVLIVNRQYVQMNKKPVQMNKKPFQLNVNCPYSDSPCFLMNKFEYVWDEGYTVRSKFNTCMFEGRAL